MNMHSEMKNSNVRIVQASKVTKKYNNKKMRVKQMQKAENNFLQILF